MKQKSIVPGGWLSLAVLLSLSAAPTPRAAPNDLGWLNANQGWALYDQQLLWSDNGGVDWRAVTPPWSAPGRLAAAAFPSATHGFVLRIQADQPVYEWARTVDGGQSWQVSALPLFAADDPAGWAQAAQLEFISPQTGWLVVERASSSNFRLGTLFATQDGGQTWERRALPIGGQVRFIDAANGWLAGGPDGLDFYSTQDGGRSWQPVQLADDGRERRAQLPLLAADGTGLLLARVGGEPAALETYQSADFGQTWRLTDTRHVAQSEAEVPAAGWQGEWWFTPAGPIERLAAGEASLRPLSAVGSTPAGLTQLQRVDAAHAWAVTRQGDCRTGNCAQTTQLWRTQDGGQSWRALAWPAGAPEQATSAAPAASAPQDLGQRTQIFRGQAFDKCNAAALSDLQTWMNTGPYRAVNLYIGGSSRGCANSLLAANYVSQARLQGWLFIPTWVGPQSACAGFGGVKINPDPTAAYNQGVSEANLALDRAAAYGLAEADGSGTVVYYDLEYYANQAACAAADQSFLSGWTTQVKARGSQAGVYSTACLLSSFAGVNPPADAIWAAAWSYSTYNANASVFNLSCLSNSIWTNSQRLRQYAGGHNETYGGVTFNIDSNVTDGPLATAGGGTPPPGSSAYVLFDRASFGGASLTSGQTMPDLAAVGWSDRARSVRVLSGFGLQVCAGTDFGPPCALLDGPLDQANLSGALDMTISSIRVCAGACPASSPPCAGCQPAASAWPMFRGNPRRTGYSAYFGPAQARVTWTRAFTNATQAGAPVSGPDGALYASLGDQLLALWPDNTLRWTFQAGGEVSPPVLTSDGRLYFGARDGVLYAVNITGTLVWTYTTGGWISASPALATDGSVYIGSSDGFLYKLSSAGALVWRRDIGAWQNSSPALGPDGLVYFGTSNYAFYALRPDGTEAWFYDTGSFIDSSPAMGGDGTLYFGSHDKHLYALWPDGSLRWAYTTGGAVSASPALGADGAVYVGSADGKLYAFEPDGVLRWIYPVGSPVNVSPLVDAAGNVYAAADDGYAYALSAAGQLRWRIYLGSELSGSLALGVNGALYVSGPGVLYALEARKVYLPALRR